jgi:hypothetical protein
MTTNVIPFPRPDAEPADRHGITHPGVLRTIIEELPESVPTATAVLLSLSRCTTEVRGRTVTIRWPDFPGHVLRVPLAVMRRNSRRTAS